MQVAAAGIPFSGTFPIAGISIGQGLDFNPNQSPTEWYTVPESLPAGILIFDASGLTESTIPVAASVSISAGPCPVAVLPPGTQEGPGYSYDIVALTVVGIGVDGPFNYLTDPDPTAAFSTTMIAQGADGLGNGYAVLASVQGVQPGDTALISGWAEGSQSGYETAYGFNGLVVIASVNAETNVITFPSSANLGDGDIVLDAGPVGSSSQVNFAIVPTQPTQVVAGSGPFALQLDDTTLPEGVDVTGNLLFVALPPCTDLS